MAKVVTRKTLMLAALGIGIAGVTAGHGRADFPQLTSPPYHGCAQVPYEQEHFVSCWAKLWAWLTYQPLSRPGLCGCCKKCEPCCQPPLYTYFPCPGCGIAMRPCPTCPNVVAHGVIATAPSARILSVVGTGLPAEPAAEPSAIVLDVEDCHPARPVQVRIPGEPSARILEVLERSAFEHAAGGPALPSMQR